MWQTEKGGHALSVPEAGERLTWQSVQCPSYAQAPSSLPLAWVVSTNGYLAVVAQSSGMQLASLAE